jgi:predicted GTPase
MVRKKVVILGAAGRDFHNFNVYFREHQEYEVVAFTATQIPGIDDKKYPAELAGSFYPKGIPIVPEETLPDVIKDYGVELVVLAYSDLPYDYVMHRAAIANAAGADFMLMGSQHTMLDSKKPVVAVCAVRTGCGKSQTSRKVCDILLKKGYKVAAIRHPMPYGDLVKQTCQRFATYDDLDKQDCTIEEREEYEPYIDMGMVVYAGVDYAEILKSAEKEADVIVWDGGNNDTPFYRADLHIVVADPHRAGHELKYYPGETNVRMANIIIINKEGTAQKENIEAVKKNIAELNPEAVVIDANSPISVEEPEKIRGKRVLVIEDGPTLTHGEMPYGAGFIAAEKYEAAKIIDPRPYAVGSLKATFQKFPHLTEILPAMGYSDQQLKDLEATINKADCDVVVSGTPIDIKRVIAPEKSIVRVRYELEEIGKPNLIEVLDAFSTLIGKRG